MQWRWPTSQCFPPRKWSWLVARTAKWSEAKSCFGFQPRLAHSTGRSIQAKHRFSWFHWTPSSKIEIGDACRNNHGGFGAVPYLRCLHPLRGLTSRPFLGNLQHANPLNGHSICSFKPSTITQKKKDCPLPGWMTRGYSKKKNNLRTVLQSYNFFSARKWHVLILLAHLWTAGSRTKGHRVNSRRTKDVLGADPGHRRKACPTPGEFPYSKGMDVWLLARKRPKNTLDQQSQM